MRGFDCAGYTHSEFDHAYGSFRITYNALNDGRCSVICQRLRYWLRGLQGDLCAQLCNLAAQYVLDFFKIRACFLALAVVLAVVLASLI